MVTEVLTALIVLKARGTCEAGRAKAGWLGRGRCVRAARAGVTHLHSTESCQCSRAGRSAPCFLSTAGDGGGGGDLMGVSQPTEINFRIPAKYKLLTEHYQQNIIGNKR